MSDPNEPTGPEGSTDQPAPTPPPTDPPPPPSSDLPPPPTPGDPYGGGVGSAGGGYGAPPSNPYGQQPQEGQGGAPYSATDALGYGWRKFFASPGTLLVPMIVVFVGVAVVAVIVELIINATILGTHSCTQTVGNVAIHTQCGPSFFVRLIGSGLASAIIILVTQLLAAGLYKGATHVTDGQSFGLGQMFDGWDKTQVVIASLIIAAATFIGTLLCYLPGLIVGFLTGYTLLFIVDKQMTAVDAIKASIKFVVDNLGNTLLFWILGALVLIVGAVICLVGLLVAAPVVLIGLAYTYRRLQNEPVVP